MSNNRIFAEREFSIIKKYIPDAAIIPYEEEVLALCEKFGNSGQSGGSAPYTAAVISNVIKKLLLFTPITVITGSDEEWDDVTEIGGLGKIVYQNNRCSAVFKDGKDSVPHYLDAIVWKGEEDWDTFTGRVYIDNNNFELISSSQNIKLPFTPKTFYVDVVRIPITKSEAEGKGLHYIEDSFGDCYYSILKDPSQLVEVFEYYIE